MRAPLLTALLCITGFLLQCAQAQQSGADTNQLTLLRAKAEKGDAQAQFELGLASSLGKFGVATDYVEAVKWYRRAAEQDHAKAQYNLGWTTTKVKAWRRTTRRP